MDFEKKLKEFWREASKGMLSKWRRAVPFGDMVSDRWERAEMLGFGRGTSVYDSSLVIGDVIVGEDVWIGPYTVLDGSGGRLEIGNNCSISSGVQIYTHSALMKAVSGGVRDIEKAPTKIGSNCYLGPNAVIEMGVVIGDGAVIGANSLVQISVPNGGMAAGNPATIRRMGGAELIA